MEVDRDALPTDDRELIDALTNVIRIIVSANETVDGAIGLVEYSERGGPAAANVLRFALVD